MPDNAPRQYVQVALDVPLLGVFDYLAKEVTQEDIGLRVKVPFGHRIQLGVIVAVSSTTALSQDKIKMIKEVLRDIPALSAELLALCRFCSAYYHYPLGQVIFSALPTRLRQLKTFHENIPRCFQAINDFRETLPKHASVQQQLATALLTPVSEIILKQISSQAIRYITRWLDAGLIQEVHAQATQKHVIHDALNLHPEQYHAVQSIIKARGFKPFLLFGVTGSGKTEVYLHAIADQLKQCRQVILLVPEINLTPQLETRFKARFAHAMIASLHSNVSDNERAHIWLKAERGEIDIILGTRLAVFTPMPNLGLIIIDEEHDSSFKQQDGFKYHARDIAVFRAKKVNIPIVLGSATPALESWYNAQCTRYHLLTLSHRAVAQAQLPSIELLSTEQVFLVDGLHPIAMKAIDQALEKSEQVLVFLNRRGYAPILHCQSCGWQAGCQRCSSRLVVHLRENALKCHLCGWEIPLPQCCPSCGNLDIKPVGQGTQRLEHTLKKHFPKTEIIRVDRDSMRQKSSWVDTFNHIKGGRGQILVGTQMLAKGHDFPHLSVAIILNTDAGLYSADFRAEERLFSQLMQVAGRVGRAHIVGKVFLQTRYIAHPLYLSLAQYDYALFATQLLQARKIAHFPPYCFQAILRAEAYQIVDALDFLRLAKQLAPESDIVIYDPIPALTQKIAGKERAQLLLQASSRYQLQQLIHQWIEILHTCKQKKVRWSIDIDPIEI